MATQARLKRSEFQFEEFSDKPPELRVSKVFTSPQGDGIRAIVTRANAVILTQDDRQDNLDIIVTLPDVGDNVAEGRIGDFFGKAWDAAKKAGKAALEGLIEGGGGGGANQNCGNVTFNGDITVSGENANAPITVPVTVVVVCN